MTAPEAPLQVREVTPHQPGGDALERVHQLGEGDLRWIGDQQVDMAVLAVELPKFGLEVDADRPEDPLQGFQVLGSEHAPPVFGYEDQVRVQDERTVSAGTDRLTHKAHRPSIILAMNRGQRARLYLTAEQEARLWQWSGTVRFLWNLARDQRRWQRDVGKTRQCLDLTDLRREVDWIADLPAQVGQQVLADLAMAWQRCWAGLGHPPVLRRRGQAIGLRFPQGVTARRLSKRWGAVRLPKLGDVRFRWTRALPGTVSSATLTCLAGTWHVAFCLEVEELVAHPNPAPAVGVDRGVEVAFMTSDGDAHDRVMWKPAEKTRLLVLERRKARQQKESNRWRRTCRSIAKLHRRAADRRRDFAHKTSTHLAKSHGLVAVEALVVPNMTRSARGTVEEPGRQVRQKAGLNRAILDKGWGLVIDQLRYKCPRQGSMLVEVPAQNTSLTCPACGHVSALNRPLRAVFVCVGCGHSDHADTNAAINIRERGIELAPTGGQLGVGRRASKRLRTWRQPAQEDAA